MGGVEDRGVAPARLDRIATVPNVLSFFRIHYDLPIWLLTPGGAACSTAGRCVLALGSRHLGTRFLPEKERTNVTDLGEFIRHGVAHGVRNVDRGGAGVDDGFDHLREEIEFGARGVLW